MSIYHHNFVTKKAAKEWLTNQLWILSSPNIVVKGINKARLPHSPQENEHLLPQICCSNKLVTKFVTIGHEMALTQLCHSSVVTKALLRDFLNKSLWQSLKKLSGFSNNFLLKFESLNNHIKLNLNIWTLNLYFFSKAFLQTCVANNFNKSFVTFFHHGQICHEIFYTKAIAIFAIVAHDNLNMLGLYLWWDLYYVTRQSRWCKKRYVHMHNIIL